MKYVIIGIGAAGMTAAKTLRELAPEDDIVMISVDEKPHSRLADKSKILFIDVRRMTK